VDWLEQLGALGPNTHLVHAVWISDAEVELIARAGAQVVHCPVSNAFLSAGVARVGHLVRSGISVSLGTDGAASNASQNLLETAKFAALSTKLGNGGRDALTAAQILRMMTTNPAALLNRGAPTALRAGAPADFTLVRMNTVRTVPSIRPDLAIIYRACPSDVHSVFVGGRRLLVDGRITSLDEEALIRECRQAADALIMRVYGRRSLEAREVA